MENALHGITRYTRRAGHARRRIAKVLPWIAVCVFPVVFFAGCCHCKDSIYAGKPFSIELSSGGGFSGLWNGFILHSDGTIESWQGKQSKTEGVTRLGTIDAGEINEIKAMIEKDGIMGRAFRETGNMTTMLRVTDGDEMRFITWPGTIEDDAKMPAEVRGVYAKIRKHIDPYRAPKDN
jgi:hypothetical protein